MVTGAIRKHTRRRECPNRALPCVLVLVGLGAAGAPGPAVAGGLFCWDHAAPLFRAARQR